MIKKNAISQKCNNQTCLKFILLTSSDPLGKQTFLNCSPAQKCLMRFSRAFFSSFIIPIKLGCRSDAQNHVGDNVILVGSAQKHSLQLIISALVFVCSCYQFFPVFTQEKFYWLVARQTVRHHPRCLKPRLLVLIMPDKLLLL